MSKSHIAFKALIIGLFLGMVSTTAVAETVAMVTDLSGVVTSSGETIEILAELEVGTHVRLAKSARVSIVYYDSANKFTFAGPAEFEIQDTAPHSLSGFEPGQESVMPEGEGSVSTLGLAQAGIVMRAGPNEPRLTLLFPVETILLNAPVSFEWRAMEPGVGYTFELTDPEGRSLIETTVTGTTLDVPDHISLIPGEYYSWSLETRLPDGRKYSNWASFSVAVDELKADVEVRRPSDETDVSRMVLYALWLEHNELLNEARRYWEKVNRLRPGATRIEARLDSNG